MRGTRSAPNPGSRIGVSDESHRVTTLELFFDLVFVFSALGILQAMIILALLWWSWVSYSWLANQTHVDEGIVRIGMSVALVAMFVVALTIPEAFDDLPGGLYGPLVLAVAYFVVGVIHLLLTYLTSTGGNWRLYSAAHWAERHGLVVILALGESIVAIGVGAALLPVSTAILVGATLAVVLSICLWWLYFDVLAIAAERILAGTSGVPRVQLGTDGYTYLHLPLIAGIMISALGVEEVIANVEGATAFGYFGAWALYGGTALYLAGHAAFWLRVGRHVKVWRLAAATVLLALIPGAAVVPPLAALAIVVALCAALVAIETLGYAEKRAEVRAER